MPTSTPEPDNRPTLLFDTNIWLDIFLPDQPNSRSSQELYTWVLRHDLGLTYPSSAILDVYRRVNAWYKAWSRQSHGSLSDAEAAAAKTIAWDRVAEMQECASSIPVDDAALYIACRYRDLHNDLEDDLVISAFYTAHASYLITNDLDLIKHSPVPAQTPADMLRQLRAGTFPGPKIGPDGHGAAHWLNKWLSGLEEDQLEA